ncbi:MAG: hypothetical protein DHS20C20_17660 [Ardenticatenaceae bacterium]|nr:MAG: hypothetical protein DHS20C20_17660 [Ardenticatenaceae bacterium]
MNWIQDHKRVWRTAVLILLLISLIGPWAFEQVHVPAEYACSPPNFRLEGDFCGTPITGMWIFTGLIGNFFSLVGRLFSGGIAFTSLFRELLFAIFSLLLVLPFFTTLLSILQKDKYARFRRASWGLALSLALLFGLFALPQFSVYPPWGIWLYSAVLIVALLVQWMAGEMDKQAAPRLTEVS